MPAPEIIHITRETAYAFPERIQSQLAALFEQGYLPREVCKALGVSYETYRSWMNKGGDPKIDPLYRCPDHIRVEPYYSFQLRMNAAQRVGKRVMRPRMPTGKIPLILTDTQQADVLEAIRAGWSFHEAARHAKIRLSTLISWLHRGGYPRQLRVGYPMLPSAVVDPYKSFVEDVLRAEEFFFSGGETD